MMPLSALFGLILAGAQVSQTQAYKADCLIFVLKDCPIANQYAPEIKRLVHTYTPKGVQFTMLIEDADATPQQVFQHNKAFGYAITTGLDQKHQTAKQFGVAISPTVVLTQHGKVLYKGRIDDTYPSVAKRHAATTHDLRDALDAFLAGKPVKHPITTAVGCKLS